MWAGHAIVAPDVAEETGQPTKIIEIEGGFDGFFILIVTSGRITTSTNVSKAAGEIPPDANVVCMQNACFLGIGLVPEALVGRYSGQNSSIGGFRQQLIAIRDASSSLRTTALDKHSAFIRWREATTRLTRCHECPEECGLATNFTRRARWLVG